MYYEKFEELCKKKGVKPGKVSKETGIASATLTNWKQGKYTPKQDKLATIANYFGVPVDYFIAVDDGNDAPVVPIVIEQCLKDAGMTDRLKLYAEFLLSQNKKTPE